MKIAKILGTVATSAWLATGTSGLATGGDDLLIAGQTSFDTIQYDPTINLLTIAGGRGDDRIEVALTKEGVRVNGVAIARPGFRIAVIPVVAIHGGGGNDVLVARGFPLVAMNGGDGRDTLVWDHGDSPFNRTTQGDDVLLWNTSEFATGGAGLDILIANTGGDRDAISGNLGRDVLLGGAGADAAGEVIFGDLGNDWIVGGTGRD